MARAKKTEQTPTVVYVGPSIPGVAKQFTTYTDGIPSALADAVERVPVLSGLLVPLDELPEVMKQLREGYGHKYRLYRLAQAKL